MNTILRNMTSDISSTQIFTQVQDKISSLYSVFKYVGSSWICVQGAQLDNSEHYKTLKHYRYKGMSKDNNIIDTCSMFNELCDKLLQDKEKFEIYLPLKNTSIFVYIRSDDESTKLADITMQILMSSFNIYLFLFTFQV